MSCGCGGAKRTSTAGAAAPGKHYAVTYADGRTQLFLSPTQAQREADRKGGTMAEVDAVKA